MNDILKKSSKKVWLLFWVIVLILFMIICIMNKKDSFLKNSNKIVKEKIDITKEVNVSKIEKNVSKEIQKEEIVKVSKKTPQITQIKSIPTSKKDISFKITKDDNNFLISGVLSSKDDYLTLRKYYPNLSKNNLTYDKDRANSKVLSLMVALRNIVNRCSSGFIEYNNNFLKIDGVVKSKEDKDIIYLTLSNIKNIKVRANIIVAVPKTKVEHIRKLSIAKIANEVKISGTFTSMEELNKLVNLFKKDGLKVNKELCVIDVDIKEDRWEVPLYAVKDYFVKLLRGTIQFDKNTFSISGDTNIEGLKQEIDSILNLNKNNLNIEENITYIEPKKVIQRIQEKVNSILKLKHIRFKKGTDEITEDTKPILDEIMQTLRLLPNLKIEIRGYTDSDGSMLSNLKLSQKRAEAVKKYLVNHGIKRKNLFAIGFGEKNPIVKNSSKENKQINRRVEFKIIGE